MQLWRKTFATQIFLLMPGISMYALDELLYEEMKEGSTCQGQGEKNR